MYVPPNQLLQVTAETPGTALIFSKSASGSGTTIETRLRTMSRSARASSAPEL